MSFLEVCKNLYKRTTFVGKLVLFSGSVAFIISPSHANAVAANKCSYYFQHRFLERIQSSIRLGDGTFVTAVEMSDLPTYPDLIESKIQKSIRHYEQTFLPGIYASRLSKYKSEGPKPTQMGLQDRTLYVFNTQHSILEKDPEFIVGTRVVVSREQEEKLPFEWDLDIDRPVGTHYAAEVGRLAKLDLDGAESIQRTVVVIQAALKILSQNSEIQTIFVHTSRAHVRLYTSMGLKPSDIIKIDNLNQIMIYTREQLLEYMKPGVLKQL